MSLPTTLATPSDIEVDDNNSVVSKSNLYTTQIADSIEKDIAFQERIELDGNHALSCTSPTNTPRSPIRENLSIRKVEFNEGRNFLSSTSLSNASHSIEYITIQDDIN